MTTQMTAEDVELMIASTPAALDELTLGLDENALMYRSGEEDWSIKEIIAHLRDADEIYLWRIEQVATKENPSLPAFDQDAYAKERHYQEMDWAPMLDGVARNRRMMVDLLLNLAKGDWERQGMHSEMGPLTLFQLAETVARHGAGHVDQIRRIRTNLRKEDATH